MSARTPQGSSALVIRDLVYAWPRSAPVLDIEEIEIAEGEHVFVHGPSGCGKSTLLGLITGVLSPTRGSVHVLGCPLHELRATQRDRFRAENVGVIFQMFNLIPFLPVRDNVLLGCRFASARRGRALARSATLDTEIRRLLERLDLPDSLLHRSVRALSIGQQQRVAAARALLGSPRLVVADEPTSALDSRARHSFLELLLAECSHAGSTLVFVSHDASLAHRFHRSLDLEALNRLALEHPEPA